MYSHELLAVLPDVSIEALVDWDWRMEDTALDLCIRQTICGSVTAGDDNRSPCLQRLAAVINERVWHPLI